MSFRKNLSLTVVAIVMAVTVAAAAKTKDAKDITLHDDADVAGSHLTSGDYSVTWQTHSPQATVTFMQGKKVVATAEGKVENRDSAYSRNEVVYGEGPGGKRQIQEIRFRGSSQVIVFSE